MGVLVFGDELLEDALVVRGAVPALALVGELDFELGSDVVPN